VQIGPDSLTSKLVVQKSARVREYAQIAATKNAVASRRYQISRRTNHLAEWIEVMPNRGEPNYAICFGGTAERH
jgi:hypothetical protein